MTWEEYLKSKDAPITGEFVWITDCRNSDKNKYIRHIKPTKVQIFNNYDLPKNKKVYYSNYHFRKLNSKGEAIKQIIAPYDNTGYRSYAGVAVQVFNTYEEAVQQYNSMLDEVVETYKNRISEIQRHIDETLENKITLG